ncbi:MAG: flavin-dependent monooxygenase, partial [Agrobacterium sp.]|nr:flavin-dependent monooxygenase [Agrobacterium sp.]
MNDMSHAPQPAQTTPRVRLTGRVAEIADLFRASARQTEEARRVPASHIEALRGIGYFDIVKPSAFGGKGGEFA